MKKTINVFYALLIGIFLIFFVALQGVRLFGLSPYVVTSGSMIPIYPVGSMIYVQETDPNEVQIGDSITFYLNEATATHQVYEIDRENKLFYTQGINNLDSEGNIIKDSSPVPFEKMIGKPVFSVPYLGEISAICTNPPGIYVVIGFVVTSFVFLFVLEQITNKED